MSMRERSNHNGDRLVSLRQLCRFDEFLGGSGGSVLVAADGQVVRYRIPDDLHQLHWTVGRPDRELVEELD